MNVKIVSPSLNESDFSNNFIRKSINIVRDI